MKHIYAMDFYNIRSTLDECFHKKFHFKVGAIIAARIASQPYISLTDIYLHLYYI